MRSLRAGVLLLFALGLLVGSAPPDFGRVTFALLGDVEDAVDGTFVADFPTGPDLARLCSVFWATRGTGADTLLVDGNSHIFNACLFSNSTMTLAGSSNTFNGDIRSVSPAFIDASNTVLGNVTQVSPRPYPTPFVFSEYQPATWPGGIGCEAAAATTAGKYFHHQENIRVSPSPKGQEKQLQDGLWFVEGNVIVDGGASGNTATFVATGTITFNIGDGGIEPFVDDLLGYTTGSAVNTIKVSGGATAGLTEGSLYAPNGEMRWQGTSNDYTGQVAASVITLAGRESTFSAGPPADPIGCPPVTASAPSFDSSSARSNMTSFDRNVTGLVADGPAWDLADPLAALPELLP